MKLLFYLSLGILFLFLGLTYISVLDRNNFQAECVPATGTRLDIEDWNEVDSVRVLASKSYKAGRIKRLMQGSQYRNAWSSPVSFKVINLDSLLGGLSFSEWGGGRQTTSVEVIDSNGLVYCLRSINKRSDEFVHKWMKLLKLDNIVTDGICAQHPYGAMAVSKMCQKLGILDPLPEMVFLPEATLTDSLKSLGNKIYFFEHETDGPAAWLNIPGAIQVTDTDGIQKIKSEGRYDITVDKNALIRARLFDMLIGDWDRHSEQWGWVLVSYDSIAITAIPMPVDRDNAFYRADGIIPYTIALHHEHLSPFRKKIRDFEDLVREFDRYFLLSTPEEIYVSEAEELQRDFTGTMINEALGVWPENINRLDAARIRETILTRKEKLVRYAKQFHETIESQGVLTEPLRGSEDLGLPHSLVHCFDCRD